MGADDWLRIAPMKVFISHAGRDAATADQVATALRKHGIESSIDASAAQIGSEWHKSVANALDASDAMLVLVSPDAMKSRGVHSEIEHALLEPRFKDRLIPLRLRPTADGSVPWILNEFQMIDLPNSTAGMQRVISTVVKRLHATSSKARPVRLRATAVKRFVEKQAKSGERAGAKAPRSKTRKKTGS